MTVTVGTSGTSLVTSPADAGAAAGITVALAVVTESGVGGDGVARAGPVTDLPVDAVLALLASLPGWSGLSGTKRNRWLRGATRVLEWLQTHPGAGWQERWLAAGADDPGWIDELAADDPRSQAWRRDELRSGLICLLLCRVVLPSHEFLARVSPAHLQSRARESMRPDLFAQMKQAAIDNGMAGPHVSQGLNTLTRIVLHTGRDLDQLTPEDIHEYRAWGQRTRGNPPPGTFAAWDLLRAIGVLPADVSLRVALREGQQSTAELVARYRIQCTPIREMLVRYLNERRPALDYSSFAGLVTVQQCRDLGQGSYWSWQSNSGPGRIYNHYQWCTWSEVDLYKISTINGKQVETGKVSYRLTVIGWGSKSTNEVVVRIYVDQARSPERSLVTPGTTTLIARVSCDFVYAGTSCASQPSSSQDAIVADLDLGQVLEFKTTVGLPAATSADPDRKTGLNLQVKFEATNPANVGAIADLGTLKTVVRCDGSTRGGFNGPACIFGGVQPSWSLSRSDPEVGEVAQHVYDALNNPNSTMPPDPSGNKYIPYNLTRTVDGNLNNAQRARAVYQCSKWFPKQPDESCDEYPFASTYEGTFNDPETNYSVRYINANHNSTEGNKRGVWYYYDRILELDGFRVNAY